MLDTIDAFTQYRREMMRHVPHELSHVGRDQQTLIIENLRLVVPIAIRYAAISSVPLLDLIQEGNLGLIRAVQDYDPSISSFSTYAMEWIEGMIKKVLTHETTSVTISAPKALVVQRIRRYLSLHPDAHVSEIANVLHLELDDAIALLALAQGVASLDTRVSEDDEETTLADFLEADDASNPESVALAQATSDSIEQLLAVLLHKEREVIEQRYGLGGKQSLTKEQTARALKMSREGVGAIETRAMLKLQRQARVTRFQEAIHEFAVD